MAAPHDQFPTDTTGLPEARSPEVVELRDGDRFDLTIAPVAKRIGDATVRMLAYNGSIPGPTLKVREGSEVLVDIDADRPSRRAVRRVDVGRLPRGRCSRRR
jgi:FtsP/CotA-like multicopper oxidase with cupredoxin domain